MTTIKSILTLLFVTTLFIIASCGQTQSKASLVDVKKNEMEIVSLLKSSQLIDEYILTLSAKNDSLLKLAMTIGKQEAIVLTIALEELKPTAPLPLDILQEAILKFGYSVKEVFIDGITKGVYTAKIICTNTSNTIILNARPSDAATIALKLNCPIFVDSKLLTH